MQGSWLRNYMKYGSGILVKFITGSGEKRDLGPVAGRLKDVIAAGAALYLIFAVLFYPTPLLHRSLAFGLF